MVPPLRTVLLALGASAAFAPAAAQSLAVRRWDVGDGLAHGRVNCIHQDARGFLWIGTWEGLSRFDGTRFVNYGLADGLGAQLVNCVSEDGQGRLWIGTNGAGLARLIDERDASGPAARFALQQVGAGGFSENVNTVTPHADGSLWLVSDDGLYVRRPGVPDACERIEAGELWNLNSARPACSDGSGRRWFGVGHTLIELAEGVLERHPLPADAPSAIACLHADARGRLLAGCSTRLYDVRRSETGALEWTALELPLGQGQELRCLASDRRGRLWIGTSRGLLLEEAGVLQDFEAGHGLPDEFVRALFCDRDGNLWIGTNSAGLLRLGEEELLGWTHADGLPENNVVQLFESRAGALLACTWKSGVVRLDGAGVEPLPGSRAGPFENGEVRLAEDARGGWWMASRQGLYRSAGELPDFEHGTEFRDRAGRAIAGISAGCALYADREGRVWVGTTDLGLWLIEPDGTLREIARDLPGPVARLMLDASGTLWIDARSAIGRWRDGKLTFLKTSPGLPELAARAFFEDAQGRVWIGLRTRGLCVTADAPAERPTFRNLTTRDGLASDTVWSLAGDRHGRVYLGTGRGLDRLDPALESIEHVGDATGFGASQVSDLRTDRAGRVWIASANGVSRLTPRVAEAPLRPQEVFLGAIDVGGLPIALPLRGTRSFELAALPAGTTSLRLDWVAPCFRGSAGSLFQYRLVGASESWSAPGPEHGVNFANLGSGDYRFEVRSVDERGRPGAPATLRFEVSPPFWRSAWFLGASALVLGLLLAGLHHARVRRILAFESLRRQIASDVHDDVGAGLAQIAVLTEVARTRTSGEARSQLEEVARLARALRESMSDIVWAVDPRRDTLGDLVQRLRQVAFNLFADESVSFELHTPAAQGFERTTLAPDVRRHLLLASKELLSNAARHAGASRVELALVLESGALELCVADDGRGFDPDAPAPGHGLHGLAGRARALRGVLAIESACGRGTRVRLRVPLSTPA